MLLLAAVLWSIHLLSMLLQADLFWLGILPRSIDGLPGIVTAPLIHGSWEHLIGNTAPLMVLGTLLLYGYPRSRLWAFSGIWLLCGLGVWLFARGNYHFGASGLTHGLFFYLFISGILRRDRRSAALLMIAFYLYGGMLLTILPGDPGVSFESHFFGALAGGSLAWLMRARDPHPSGKRYSWQTGTDDDTDAEEDDPIIGDQWRT